MISWWCVLQVVGEGLPIVGQIEPRTWACQTRNGDAAGVPMRNHNPVTSACSLDRRVMAPEPRRKKEFTVSILRNGQYRLHM